MDLREVEVLIAELETRTDRLRALYEQYFMGFERLEPTVPRKDVERRIQQLLRVPFRNTALRFRFTMLQQRYNTYQTYWMRTCRRIEDGTYKRQISRLRAKEADRLDRMAVPHEVRIAERTSEIELDASDLQDDFEADDLGFDDDVVWAKPPPGNTFDTRPTRPQMAAVRIDALPPSGGGAKPAPSVARAAAAAPPAPPSTKPPPPPPKKPARPMIAERPTVPAMTAVQLPLKK